jgi:hypothetical protein
VVFHRLINALCRMRNCLTSVAENAYARLYHALLTPQAMYKSTGSHTMIRKTEQQQFEFAN